MMRFVAISMCIHAALLLSWTHAFQFAGQQETTLSVTFDAPTEIAAPETTETTPSKSQKMASRSTRRGNASRAAITAKSDMMIKARSTPVSMSSQENGTDNSASASQREQARAQVKAHLLADLRRYFEYPMMALNAGWQGTVWLSVTLEPDGRVDQINVTRSSGYDVLDSSAIKAMKRVGRLSEAEQWLSGRSLEVPIPVVYRITGS